MNQLFLLNPTCMFRVRFGLLILLLRGFDRCCGLDLNLHWATTCTGLGLKEVALESKMLVTWAKSWRLRWMSLDLEVDGLICFFLGAKENITASSAGSLAFKMVWVASRDILDIDTEPALVELEVLALPVIALTASTASPNSSALLPARVVIPSYRVTLGIPRRAKAHNVLAKSTGLNSLKHAWDCFPRVWKRRGWL